MTTPHRTLPLFERIRIASPCDVPWDTMRGDDQVRRCDQCDRNVYDLSSLTRNEVERLFDAHDEPPCVSYFQRPDGTVLLADCPVGVRRRRWRPFSALAVATLASVASLVACSQPDETTVRPEPWAAMQRPSSEEAPCESDPVPGSRAKQARDEPVNVSAAPSASSLPGLLTPVQGMPSRYPRTAGIPPRHLTRDSKGHVSF